MEKNIEFEANYRKIFGEKTQGNGPVNDYDYAAAAQRDHEEIMKNHKTGLTEEEKSFLASFGDDVVFEMKEKNISKEKFDKLKKAVMIIGGSVIAGAAIVLAADVMINPDLYFTTGEYAGPPGSILDSFSRVYEFVVEKIGGLKR